MDIGELIRNLEEIQKQHPDALIYRHDSEFNEVMVGVVYVENGVVYIG